MNSKIIVAILIFAVAVAGVLVYLKSPQDGSTTVSTQRELKTFYSQTYALAFNYPDSYQVKESDTTGEGTKHHAIVLTDKSASQPVESDGPPAITVDIYANSGNESTEKWIKGTANSNYKLSPDGTLTDITIAGEKAKVYVWDGLYRSTSIVFAYKSNIYMLSVGSIAQSDQILKDFAEVVSSVQLDP